MQSKEVPIEQILNEIALNLLSIIEVNDKTKKELLDRITTLEQKVLELSK
jgi:hypothetical protein